MDPPVGFRIEPTDVKIQHAVWPGQAVCGVASSSVPLQVTEPPS